jgi:hypothetical protein
MSITRVGSATTIATTADTKNTTVTLPPVSMNPVYPGSWGTYNPIQVQATQSSSLKLVDPILLLDLYAHFSSLEDDKSKEFIKRIKESVSSNGGIIGG